MAAEEPHPVPGLGEEGRVADGPLRRLVGWKLHNLLRGQVFAEEVAGLIPGDVPRMAPRGKPWARSPAGIPGTTGTQNVSETRESTHHRSPAQASLEGYPRPVSLPATYRAS
ncbi:hypothetical protein LR090_01235 [Candidatus Bipolaricaulota bacterium]|nr:hypothetical protein [Candidatus Bipolaricaulota bacterium]